MYDEKRELTRHVFNSYNGILNDEENYALWNLNDPILGISNSHEGLYFPLLRIGCPTFGNPELDAQFKKLTSRIVKENGPKIYDFPMHYSKEWSALHRKFIACVIDRVLRENVFIKRCPKCQKILRTPRAKLCIWCGFHCYDAEQTQID